MSTCNDRTMSTIIPTPKCICTPCTNLIESQFQHKLALLNDRHTYTLKEAGMASDHEEWLAKLLSPDQCIIIRECPLRKMAKFGNVCSEKVLELVVNYRRACEKRYRELLCMRSVDMTPLDRFNIKQIQKLHRKISPFEPISWVDIAKECCRYGNVEMMKLIISRLATTHDIDDLLATVEPKITAKSFGQSVGADSGPWPSDDQEDYETIARMLHQHCIFE